LRFPADPILDSPWAQGSEMEEKIQDWIDSFQTRESDLMRECLVRMGRYREAVKVEVERKELPGSLVYLPIVESWYNPRAVSWVGAAGLWQFMPSTARGMGLHVDRVLDERRDPFLSTAPALDYLSELKQRFGSWFLALAAYNGGPGRVERLLRGRGEEAGGHDGLFLEILVDLPRETQDFVPRFLAAARVARDPAAFGFGDVVAEGAIAYDEVEVPDATSLDVVARASGVEQAAVEALNPQLLRGLTPAGVRTPLRLPAGVGERFTEAFQQIPPEERVTFVEHAVAKGETLTHIARYYGVSVDDLFAANPRVEPRLLQIGQRVVVPKAPSVLDGLRAAAGTGPERVMVYSVRPGDTISAIAARHRVTVGDLLRWNGLSMDSVIRPGDQVRIHLPGG
jgi:membrane-bound lytic murein transglycosylase D